MTASLPYPLPDPEFHISYLEEGNFRFTFADDVEDMRRIDGTCSVRCPSGELSLVGRSQWTVLKTCNFVSWPGLAVFRDDHPTTKPLMGLFHQRTRDFKPGLRINSNLLDYPLAILVCDRIEVLPDWRGTGVAKAIFVDGICRLGEDCLVVCQPRPLQSDPLISLKSYLDKRLSDFPVDESEASTQLIRHLELCGFIQVPDSDPTIMTFGKSELIPHEYP